MLSTFSFSTDAGHTYHELHDNKCNQIGQKADPTYPFSLDSKLPDPINFGSLEWPQGEARGQMSFVRMFYSSPSFHFRGSDSTY